MPQISVLRYYRKKKHITVQKLSEDLHIPVGTIKWWECLGRSITIKKAILLGDYFKIEPALLAGKQVIHITGAEYTQLYRPHSIYIPSEIKVHDKHKKIMDQFLYGKRALPKNSRGLPTIS